MIQHSEASPLSGSRRIGTSVCKRYNEMVRLKVLWRFLFRMPGWKKALRMQQETNKIAYRIDEAVKASGLGRTFLYERMASGELKSIKVGARRLILREDLLEFLRLPEGRTR